MNNAEELKKIVKDKYSEIALQSKEQNEASCCGATGCGTVDYAIFADNYTELEGYNPDADLGLGCGVPTEFAQIKKGDVVLDLGSGAGNDCFVARAIVGETGKVIGVDMTEAMIAKARDNAEKLNFNNVEFRQGEIEDLPLAANRVDVVISNCVLNLVPNKQKAFAETYRVLKPGGHFSISDVVLAGDLPAGLVNDAEMYAGCVSGAIQKEEYLDIIRKAGFENVVVQKEKAIQLPDEILKDYLSEEGIKQFRESNTGIFSITVYGDKPAEAACCAPGSGCC
ncbi:arsenite methyltransferase [Pontibacter sp. BT310]|uniref:Arsenite methyltransferase n=1 Tax=Pontibacter populi TaxID=890055 RepID=A0ABS6X6D9_9BACT|nr:MULTISPECIES: arsenite methyltransferase [Pontibacter]MBJ6116714.1 arsenite methyltransferase [Pontibacter sp. BT310]MBR0569138.1 arsenite methyltransferase [Microvirga sp. STS03]MBW3363568.1 arsenite methyltransferase [Pontibacter populi]